MPKVPLTSASGSSVALTVNSDPFRTPIPIHPSQMCSRLSGVIPIAPAPLPHSCFGCASIRFVGNDAENEVDSDLRKPVFATSLTRAFLGPG